jgi:hypothetical protein
VVADQGAPSCIPELNGPTRGLHHVREEHGCHHARRLCAVAGTGEEFLDLVKDCIGVADPREMVAAWKRDESRVRYSLSQVPRSADTDA